MVVRTQISLDSELHGKAKNKAAQMGISLAEYFRRVVGSDLVAEPKKDVSAIFDLGRSEDSDVSANVDRYVGDAVDADYKEDSANKLPGS